MLFNAVLASTLGAALVAAHPGHDHSKEAAERRAFQDAPGRRSVGQCAQQLRERGVDARAAERRANLAKKAMKKRGIKRDLETILSTSHESSEAFTPETALSTVFAGNNSCLLAPETTEGPYYVAGEAIRSNLVDGQEGIPMFIDAQVIDVTTCEPIPDAFVEIWHANATGVYAGVINRSNGVGVSDTANLDRTYGRGIQSSDADGAVQFESFYPGHYRGRTTHIHVMVHMNAEAQENGTVIDTNASHIGQMYFDQELIYEVEATAPYNTNTEEFTTNDIDEILEIQAKTEDPFLEYVRLGESIEDGVLAWLSFGIDPNFNREVKEATVMTENGGVQSTDPWSADEDPYMPARPVRDENGSIISDAPETSASEAPETAASNESGRPVRGNSGRSGRPSRGSKA